MFDALIREISQRFGLGDKAQDLVTSLLALIFEPNSGGIEGLAAKLQQQGLGDLLSTWLGGSAGPATAINPQQVENVLGSSQLSGIADKLGVARGTVVAAASAALPKIISAVSSNGQLPTGIPASISGMLGELGGLGGAGTGVASSADAAASTMASAASSAASSVENAANGSLGWLKWLILAAIVLALGYCMMNRKSETPPAPPTAAASAPTPPPAAASAPAPAQETAAPVTAAPETAPATATDAKTALSALTPGKFSADDLVKALNLMIVHFDTGSATISADSIDVLTDVANALKAAPAGSKVEIGGHTDNTGDAAANLKLSDERANAVRNKLVGLGVAANTLSAKGYGDTKPVADNATEEGRAKNRRIEFTVQP